MLRERFAGLARPVRRRPSLACAPGRGLSKVWIDRIDNPKTGRPIGSGPFLVERWERGKAAHARPEPPLLGAAPRLSRSARRPLLILRCRRRPVGGSRAATDDGRLRLRRDTAARVGSPAIGVGRVRSRTPAAGCEHFELRLGPGGHPALKSKLVRQALAYGIDRAAIVTGVLRASSTRGTRYESAVFLSQQRYYEPNWSRYRYRPALARACSSGRAAGAAATASTRAGVSGSRCAS